MNTDIKVLEDDGKFTKYLETSLPTLKVSITCGSVVILKNGKTKLMIIGYCKCMKKDKIKENDYIACVYPLGVIDFKNTLAFKSDQIDEVLFIGKNSPEYEKLNEILQ